MLAPVACIGSGLIGRSWAIVFARAGHEVRLWDAKPRHPKPLAPFVPRFYPSWTNSGSSTVPPPMLWRATTQPAR